MQVTEGKAGSVGGVLLLLHPEFIELLAFRSGARNCQACTVREHCACLTKASNNTITSDVEPTTCTQISCVEEVTVFTPVPIHAAYSCNDVIHSI